MTQSTLARAIGSAIEQAASGDRFVNDPYVKYLSGLMGISPEAFAQCISGVQRVPGKTRILFSPNALSTVMTGNGLRGTFRWFVQNGLENRLKRLGFTKTELDLSGLFENGYWNAMLDPKKRGLVAWDDAVSSIDHRSYFYIIDATVQDKYAHPMLANKGFKNGSKQKRLEAVFQWVDLACNEEEYDWLKGQRDYKLFGLPQYLDEGMKYKYVAFDEGTGVLSWTTQDYGDRRALVKFLRQCLGKVGLLGEGGVRVVRVCYRDDNLDDSSSSNKGWTVFKVA